MREQLRTGDIVVIENFSRLGRSTKNLLSAIFQFERDIIVQRTFEGLESARSRGRVGGRPPIDDKKLEKAYKLYLMKTHSIKEICSITGISQGTLYKYINKRLENKN